MKVALRIALLLGVLILSAWMCDSIVVQAQDGRVAEVPVLSEGHPQAMSALSSNYVYRNLQHNAFLRSDASGVIYIQNLIQNWALTPMEAHTWCFYWGPDKYSNVFARDPFGYLDVEYYQDYSAAFESWGLCIEAAFRYPIQFSDQYLYGVGVVIEDHHRVEEEVIGASWRVSSDSSIQRYVSKASWPYNHEGYTAEPTPDEVGEDYALWERTEAQAPWEFTVNVRVTLTDTMAVDALTQGTSPYDGRDVSWEDDEYGQDTGKTIGDWGCYLTSGTMAMNYFAEVLGFATSIDPGDLNSWLKEPASEGSTSPRGYASGSGCPTGSYCLVNSAEFDEASAELFDSADDQPLIIPGSLEKIQGVAGMRDNLQNGQLGILNVSNGGNGHFVLVKGFARRDGVDTVVINDPYESRGSTTLYEQYGNSHLGNVRWFSHGEQTVRPNYVTLYADCPVELLVTDRHGRRTGYEPTTGRLYNEIPSSSYVIQYHPCERISEGDGTKILQIQTMDYSQFKVEVIGTGSGSYELRYVAELAYAEDSARTVSGSTSYGEVDQYEITFDPNTGFLTCTAYLPLVIH